jgi:hypothetical protein
MIKDIISFIHGYNPKWFAADFLFASDILANSIWGSKYYEVFTYMGFSSGAISTIVSILELVRILILIQERHKGQNNRQQ